MPPFLRNGSFLFVLQSQPFYQTELVPVTTISILRSSPASSSSEEVVHGRNVIAFFVWAWYQAFVTESVSLGELLHEGSYRRQKGGSTPRTLIPV